MFSNIENPIGMDAHMDGIAGHYDHITGKYTPPMSYFPPLASLSPYSSWSGTTASSPLSMATPSPIGSGPMPQFFMNTSSTSPLLGSSFSTSPTNSEPSYQPLFQLDSLQKQQSMCPLSLNIPVSGMPTFDKNSVFTALTAPEGMKNTPGYSHNGKRLGRPIGSTKDKKLREARMEAELEHIIEYSTCSWVDCKGTFNSKKEFFIHVENEHVDDQNGPWWVCDWDECDHPAFPSLYLLVNHVRKHTHEKPYSCSWPECDKQYSRKENLKTHYRVHTGDKPYTCKFVTCRKKFSNASDCSKHQNRVHSDSKPYVCRYPDCTKSYTDPSSLRKHVKAHHDDFETVMGLLPKRPTVRKSRLDKISDAIALARSPSENHIRVARLLGATIPEHLSPKKPSAAAPVAPPPHSPIIAPMPLLSMPMVFPQPAPLFPMQLAYNMLLSQNPTGFPILAPPPMGIPPLLPSNVLNVCMNLLAQKK